MRGDRQRAVLARLGELPRLRRQKVETVRIDEHGQRARALEDALQAPARQLVLAEAATDHHRVGPLAGLGHGGLVIDVDEDRLGHGRLADLAVSGVGGDADDSGTHGQRSPRRQHAGARHAAPPGGDQQVAGVSLVGVRRALRQPRTGPVGRDDLGRDLAIGHRRKADLGGDDAAAARARRLKEEPELRVSEGDGQVSVDAGAGDGAGGEIDAGGPIDGDPHGAAGVDRLDDSCLRLLRCAAAARAQDAVQDDARRSEGAVRHLR